MKSLPDSNTQTSAGVTPDIVDSTRPPPRILVVRCFGCGEQGHRQASCHKNGRHGLFTEDAPVYDEDPDAEIIEETLTGDAGMAMVVFFHKDLRSHGYDRTFFVLLTLLGGKCANLLSTRAVVPM